MRRVAGSAVLFLASLVIQPAYAGNWENLDRNQQRLVDLMAEDLFTQETRGRGPESGNYEQLPAKRKSKYRERAISELGLSPRKALQREA